LSPPRVFPGSLHGNLFLCTACFPPFLLDGKMFALSTVFVPRDLMVLPRLYFPCRWSCSMPTYYFGPPPPSLCRTKGAVFSPTPIPLSTWPPTPDVELVPPSDTPFQSFLGNHFLIAGVLRRPVRPYVVLLSPTLRFAQLCFLPPPVPPGRTFFSFSLLGLTPLGGRSSGQVREIICGQSSSYGFSLPLSVKRHPFLSLGTPNSSYLSLFNHPLFSFLFSTFPRSLPPLVAFL